MQANQTELLATETLLQRGVRVKARAPLLFRLVGIKNINLTLSTPTAGALLRMGHWYLRCQLPIDKLEQVSMEDALQYKVKYSENIYRALACLFIGNALMTRIFLKPYASWLREALTDEEVLTLLQLVLVHGGLQSFMTTTRYIRGVMITIPRLGQTAKRS